MSGWGGFADPARPAAPKPADEPSLFAPARPAAPKPPEADEPSLFAAPTRPRPEPAKAEVVEPPKPPGPLPESASPEQRFKALRDHLRPLHLSFRVIVEDCVFAGVNEGALQLSVPSDLAMNKLRRVQDDATLLGAVRVLFPGVVRVEPRMRAEGEGQTARENHAGRVKAQQALIEQEVQADPLIKLAKEELGASIVSIESLVKVEEE